MQKDSDWIAIDGEPCRVINFTPLGSVVKNDLVESIDFTTPYAIVDIECKKLPGKIMGFICHKIDFKYLWTAFKDRGIKENEEVVIFYSRNHYKLTKSNSRVLKKFLKISSYFWPRLRVMIIPKGAFENMSNLDSELRNINTSYIWDDIKIDEYKLESEGI